MSAGELLYAEAKRLQEQCARLQDEVRHWQRQIEILWEIGSGNITPEQLENARKGKLIWEADVEFKIEPTPLTPEELELIIRQGEHKVRGVCHAMLGYEKGK